MKKLFFILLAFGLSIPAFAQRSQTTFFKTLSQQRGLDPIVRKATIGLSKNGIIADSLLYFTSTLEKAVLQGKSAGTLKPDLIKAAQQKYPGNTVTAVNNRLKLYATESRR